MSPDQPADSKPRKAKPGDIVYPLGEDGNSPPFIVVEKERPPRKGRKVRNRKAKRKAARKAKRKNRAAA